MHETSKHISVRNPSYSYANTDIYINEYLLVKNNAQWDSDSDDLLGNREQPCDGVTTPTTFSKSRLGLGSVLLELYANTHLKEQHRVFAFHLTQSRHVLRLLHCIGH